MGYTSQENYRRIRQEYETKYLRAQEAADARLAEVHAAIPALVELDKKLGGLGIEILRIVHEGGDVEAGVAALRAENQAMQERRRELLASHGFPADYTDVKYECPLCGDTGFVDCKMCACMRRRLIEAGYESSGVGELLRTQSFENFSLGYYADDPRTLTRMRRIFNIMKEYADRFVPASQVEAGIDDLIENRRRKLVADFGAQIINNEQIGFVVSLRVCLIAYAGGVAEALAFKVRQHPHGTAVQHVVSLTDDNARNRRGQVRLAPASTCEGQLSSAPT